MRVRVQHGIGDLTRDLAALGPQMVVKGSAVVKRNVRRGRNAARGFSREKAGPHGANFYKRITDEVTGPMEGEYGPPGNPERFIGVGYRSGRGEAPNNDLPRSQDVVRPLFHKDVDGMLDDLFWPGGDR